MLCNKFLIIPRHPYISFFSKNSFYLLLIELLLLFYRCLFFASKRILFTSIYQIYLNPLCGLFVFKTASMIIGKSHPQLGFECENRVQHHPYRYNCDLQYIEKSLHLPVEFHPSGQHLRLW